MLGQINHPQNFLPFFKKSALRQRFHKGCSTCRWGLPVPVNTIPRFSIPYTGSVTAVTFRLLDEDGAPITSLSPSLLKITTFADGNSIIRYKGANLGTTLTCGIYQVEVGVNGRATYYSEDIEMLTLSDTADWWKLLVSSEVDVAGHLWQGSYVQELYFQGYHDTPAQRVDVQADVDGAGAEYLVSQDVKTRYSLKVPYVPDYLLHAMTSLREMASAGSVVLYSLANTASFELQNVEFSSDPQADDCFNVGNLTFETAHTIFAGCPVDMEVTTLDVAG